MTKSDQIDVTIAIVNWNSRPLLKACLQSIAAGVGERSVETIVVDNASQDGSQAMLLKEFPHITVIVNEANLGYARGNNQALAIAKGQYFLLLNPDTVVRPLAIERMVAFLDAHTEVIGVTCKLLNLDGSFQRYYKRLPTWKYIATTHTLFRSFYPNNRWTQEFYMLNEPFDAVCPVEQPAAACLMLRRERLPKEGLFDERFPIFFNDIDLCRQLSDQGEILWFLPEPEVVHHGSGGGVGSLKDQAIIDYLIGWIRYVRKRQGALAATACWLMVTLNSVCVLFAGLLYILAGKRSIPWFLHEGRRHWRLIWGLDTFRYPPRTTLLVPRWS